jgi:hypothetical protein
MKGAHAVRTRSRYLLGIERASVHCFDEAMINAMPGLRATRVIGIGG